MTAPSSESVRFEPNLSALIGSALARRIAEGTPCLDDAVRAVPFEALVRRTWVDAPAEALIGRRLMLITHHPLNAALALCSLDAVAARLVICPPDLAREHLPLVVADAEVDAIVHDGAEDGPLAQGVRAYRICPHVEGYGDHLPTTARASEWAMFTSGTTGRPKMVVHDLAGLTDAMPIGAAPEAAPIVWATFYDIRRFGGMQMLLRALTGAHTMMLASPEEPMTRFIERIAAAGATHVSGTPSHWRSALLNPALGLLSPRYVRLSGEIADQPLLDRLTAFFPKAAVGHAYASTEAGVGFEVTDRLEGFPAAFLMSLGAVEMRVQDETLRIRSPRTARYYLGDGREPVADADGFVDTGDLLQQRGDRFYFMGRANGVINVGGLKVHPEEVEAVINRCRGVRMARVKERRNPIIGAVVTAEVVLDDPSSGVGDAARAAREAILEQCRSVLPEFKVPASLKFVDDLPITAGGKLERRSA
jgi:acyl-coenzyme A synthetase/AMP-(fatty) acid ligase